MTDSRMRIIASVGLVLGAVLGIAGTFAPDAALRGLAWGVDGTALVLAAALLMVHHLRLGNDMMAAGYAIFGIGEALIVSGSAVELTASGPVFGAGSALWAASLALVSAPKVLPSLVRGFGFIASILFTIVALQIFAGRALTPLSSPLPFFAYPFLAASLLGWAWALLRPGKGSSR